MYTVCGHAHPHQARPNRAVSRKIAIAMLISSSMKSRVSVGRNV